MVEKESAIPLKFERYLQTIARRDGIEKLRVAGVLTCRGRIIMRHGRVLSVLDVEGSGIDVAVAALIEACGGDAIVRYIGYSDGPGNTRQYNFEIVLGNRSADFEFAPNDGDVLPDEARVIAALRKKQRLAPKGGPVFPSVVFVLKNIFL